MTRKLLTMYIDSIYIFINIKSLRVNKSQKFSKGVVLVIKYVNMRLIYYTI